MMNIEFVLYEGSTVVTNEQNSSAHYYDDRGNIRGNNIDGNLPDIVSVYNNDTCESYSVEDIPHVYPELVDYLRRGMLYMDNGQLWQLADIKLDGHSILLPAPPKGDSVVLFHEFGYCILWVSGRVSDLSSIIDFRGGFFYPAHSEHMDWGYSSIHTVPACNGSDDIILILDDEGNLDSPFLRTIAHKLDEIGISQSLYPGK